MFHLSRKFQELNSGNEIDRRKQKTGCHAEDYLSSEESILNQNGDDNYYQCDLHDW